MDLEIVSMRQACRPPTKFPGEAYLWLEIVKTGSEREGRQRQDSGNDCIHDRMIPPNLPCIGSFSDGDAVSWKGREAASI